MEYKHNADPTQLVTKSTNLLKKIDFDYDFVDMIDTFGSIIEKCLKSIETAQLHDVVPFHYNTLEVLIPSYHVQRYMPGLDVDITVLFQRTNFTDEHNLTYDAETISNFYRTASVTIGKAHSTRVYHINFKNRNGEYQPIHDNIVRLYHIDKNHNDFPQLTYDGLCELVDDLVTIVNPATSRFPRSFSA